LAKLRISIVQYLNTAPLVRGFTHGPLRGKYELSFTVPSQCAEALRTGAADIAIIPAIEYQRIDNLVVLPDIAIASESRVRSLLVVSRKPLAEVQSFVLDRSSRSTQAIVRILAADHWKIAPQFTEAEPDLRSMLMHADAALLIGDPALRLALAIGDDAPRGAAGEMLCSGAAAGIGGAETLRVYDVGEEWRRCTSLPAVLALWAARSDAVLPEVVADFTASREFGLRQIPEISREAAAALQLPEAALADYLNKNIDYTLSAENIQGLEHFYSRAAALGLIPCAKPIAWAADIRALRNAGTGS